MIRLFDEYKILIVLLLAITLIAAFDQVESTDFPIRRSLSHVKTTLPEFLSVLTKYISFVSLFWIICFGATKFNKQLMIAAILATGFLVDFLLESNVCWFNIGVYAFGYRSLAFLIFGVVIIATIIKEKWISV